MKLYVEGGGQKAADIRLRRGFHGLIAHDSGEETARKVQIVACGNTSETYKDFCYGMKSASQPNTCLAILVDSDTLVNQAADAWQAIAGLDGCGPCPSGADADCAHLMVQVMESWIVTDPDNLARFYGGDFEPGQLPRNLDVERVPKADVYASLKKATKHTGKEEYHKARHGFDLIEGVDPARLRSRSVRAQRFLDFVRTRVES